jgi:hypothetical protein
VRRFICTRLLTEVKEKPILGGAGETCLSSVPKVGGLLLEEQSVFHPTPELRSNPF